MSVRSPPASCVALSIPGICTAPGAEFPADDEMFVLQRSIEAALPQDPSHVVQFTASRAGEGTSTVTQALGMFLAVRARRTTLILEANEANPCVQEPQDAERLIGWNETILGNKPPQRAIYASGFPRLWSSPLCVCGGAVAPVRDGAALAAFFEKLREWFDYVLIDSGPVTGCPGALAMAQHADGTVLVLEAERTRWPVALSAKNAILRVGGRVLGTVLNKRRHHIPSPIYRWL
jgi:Mrp family chromosome partitioning ATPase